MEEHMTREEATDAISSAAHKGDPAEDNIAQDNLRAKRFTTSFVAAVTTLWTAACYLIFCGGRNDYPDVRLPNDPMTVRTSAEAEQTLRVMLRNPALTDRIIERMRDPSFIETLINDPKIMDNLQQIADAIEQGAHKTPVGAIGEKRRDDGATRSNWTDKAAHEQDKSVGSGASRN